MAGRAPTPSTSITTVVVYYASKAVKQAVEDSLLPCFPYFIFIPFDGSLLHSHYFPLAFVSSSNRSPLMSSTMSGRELRPPVFGQSSIPSVGRVTKAMKQITARQTLVGRSKFCVDALLIHSSGLLRLRERILVSSRGVGHQVCVCPIFSPIFHGPTTY